MTLLLIAAMIYAVLAFAGSQFLLALSAPAFALLVYIFPLILNFLVTKMQKNDTQKLIASLVSPTLTVLFYVGLFLCPYLQELGQDLLKQTMLPTAASVWKLQRHHWMHLN